MTDSAGLGNELGRRQQGEWLMTSYEPAPIDTSRVEVPGDLAELMELLARNTHEVWSSRRLEEGWTQGPTRDDARKHHPCLIPYEQLPESEKQYDRDTSLQTIKAILALGFRIERIDGG